MSMKQAKYEMFKQHLMQKVADSCAEYDKEEVDCE